MGRRFIVVTTFANRLSGGIAVAWAFVKALKDARQEVWLASLDKPNYELAKKFFPFFAKPDKHIFELSPLDLVKFPFKGNVFINAYADAILYPLDVNYYHTDPLGVFGSLTEGVKQFVEDYIYDANLARDPLNFANSKRTKRLLEKFGIKSEVLYPPVPKPKYHPKVEKEDMVVYFGRVARDKNLDLILEVAKELPDVKFVVAGKPAFPFAWEFMEKAKQLKNVEVIPKILDEKEKAELFARAKALILTRKNEPFGIAPLEGVWLGAVPVLPCSAGAHEVVESIPCWRDESEVAKVIEEVLRNHRKYAELAVKGVEENASFDAFKERLFNHLRRRNLL